METTREVIVELLSQLDGNREVRQYLKRFSRIDSNQFAVIKVGGGILEHELEELAAALSFLRHVGLFPIVVHGAGSQLNSALKANGVDSKFVDNIRVTSPDVMRIARPVIYQQSQQLVAALEKRGVRAQMIQHGVFECSYLDKQRYQLVGQVEEVRTDVIESAIDVGALPIVSCLGESASGQVLNINADIAANALVRAIQPYKVVFLTPTGGLLNESGGVIPALNLATDFTRLMSEPWLHSGMRLKLQQIHELLLILPASASVSITSAKRLTRELFTHGGSGTLLRRGEHFYTSSKPSDDQQAKLKALLELCFERELDGTYFEQANIAQVIYSDSYRAAAIIMNEPDGTYYMDKFAVTPDAQGEGLGATLWDRVKQQFPKLYWRSRADNPINSWYFKQADLSTRIHPWYVFAIGFERAGALQDLAQKASSKPESWSDSEVSRVA